MSNLNGKAIGITSSNISGTVDDTLVTKEIAFSQMGNNVKFRYIAIRIYIWSSSSNLL